MHELSLVVWPVEVSPCCVTQTSHSSGFSYCRAWALGGPASVAVVHGLSCHMACGAFLKQGSNLCPCVGKQILNH